MSKETSKGMKSNDKIGGSIRILNLIEARIMMSFMPLSFQGRCEQCVPGKIESRTIVVCSRCCDCLWVMCLCVGCAHICRDWVVWLGESSRVKDVQYGCLNHVRRKDDCLAGPAFAVHAVRGICGDSWPRLDKSKFCDEAKYVEGIVIPRDWDVVAGKRGIMGSGVRRFDR